MEPLSPNDPLHTLLGRARPVEPRPNFTQNVMRAIRQVPQSFGLWDRVQAWFGGSTPRMALAGVAAALVVGGLVVFATQQHDAKSSVVAQQVQTPVVQAQQQQLPIQSPIYHVSAAMILAATAEVTPAGATVAESEDRDPMGLLLAQEDSSALTDSELALLVY